MVKARTSRSIPKERAPTPGGCRNCVTATPALRLRNSSDAGAGRSSTIAMSFLPRHASSQRSSWEPEVGTGRRCIFSKELLSQKRLCWPHASSERVPSRPPRANQQDSPASQQLIVKPRKPFTTIPQMKEKSRHSRRSAARTSKKDDGRAPDAAAGGINLGATSACGLLCSRDCIHRSRSGPAFAKRSSRPEPCFGSQSSYSPLNSTIGASKSSQQERTEPGCAAAVDPPEAICAADSASGAGNSGVRWELSLHRRWPLAAASPGACQTPLLKRAPKEASALGGVLRSQLRSSRHQGRRMSTPWAMRLRPHRASAAQRTAPRSHQIIGPSACALSKIGMLPPDLEKIRRQTILSFCSKAWPRRGHSA